MTENINLPADDGLRIDPDRIAESIAVWFEDHTEDLVDAITQAVMRRTYAQVAERKDSPVVTQIMSILSDGEWHPWQKIADDVMRMHGIDRTTVFEMIRTLQYADRLEKRGRWQSKTKYRAAADSREARMTEATA